MGRLKSTNDEGAEALERLIRTLGSHAYLKADAVAVTAELGAVKGGARGQGAASDPVLPAVCANEVARPERVEDESGDDRREVAKTALTNHTLIYRGSRRPRLLL